MRFITMYGQSVNTVSNQELFYTFQGMTNDQRYYVSVDAAGELRPSCLTANRR
jgi:hypothetical protein